MKTAWLVITDKELLPFVDKYKVFSEDKLEDALKWAKELGYRDPFGIGLNDKIGILNMYQEKYMVGIMHIEIQ